MIHLTTPTWESYFVIYLSGRDSNSTACLIGISLKGEEQKCQEALIVWVNPSAVALFNINVCLLSSLFAFREMLFCRGPHNVCHVSGAQEAKRREEKDQQHRIGTFMRSDIGLFIVVIDSLYEYSGVTRPQDRKNGVKHLNRGSNDTDKLRSPSGGIDNGATSTRSTFIKMATLGYDLIFWICETNGKRERNRFRDSNSILSLSLSLNRKPRRNSDEDGKRPTRILKPNKDKDKGGRPGAAKVS